MITRNRLTKSGRTVYICRHAGVDFVSLASMSAAMSTAYRAWLFDRKAKGVQS